MIHKPLLTLSNARRKALWIGAAAAGAGAGALGLGLAAEAPRRWLIDGLQASAAHLGHSTSLPNWSVYLLSACALACAWQLRRRGMARPLRERLARPSAYLRDQFLGVQWEWTYDAQQHPRNLWSACPTCATRLVSFVTKPPEERRVKMFCEHCRLTLLSEPGDRDYLHARVARQIERKLRTGTWRDSVPAGVTAEPQGPGSIA
jgi:hypothetical protein